jgi:hypothetical protein
MFPVMPYCVVIMSRSFLCGTVSNALLKSMHDDRICLKFGRMASQDFIRSRVWWHLV